MSKELVIEREDASISSGDSCGHLLIALGFARASAVEAEARLSHLEGRPLNEWLAWAECKLARR